MLYIFVSLHNHILAEYRVILSRNLALLGLDRSTLLPNGGKHYNIHTLINQYQQTIIPSVVVAPCLPVALSSSDPGQ